MSGVIHWMNNNLTSGRGKVVCLYETDTVEARWNPQDWFPPMWVYGDVSIGLHAHGLGGAPDASANRKTARFTVSNNLNYIDIWSDCPQLTIVGLNMEFTAGTASYCFIRALGGQLDIIGCKIIQAGTNYTGRVIESIDGANTRIRPLRAFWRGSSLSAADPYFEGKNLAALEMENIKAAHLVFGQNSGKIKIVEYSYAGYGVSSFTEGARIHLKGTYHLTRANMGLRAVSSYESNGPAFTEDAQAIRTASGDFLAFDAAAFCSMAFNSYNDGNNSFDPVLEGAETTGGRGTENVDYRLVSAPTFNSNFKIYASSNK